MQFRLSVGNNSGHRSLGRTDVSHLRPCSRRSVRVHAAATVERRRQKRTENVEGSFFVDTACIDCDACRWIAPQVFGREGSQSAVVRQPQSEEDRVLASQALLSCPTHSIHAKDAAKAAVERFPEPVDGAPGVYYTGYHSERSFGGAAWLVTDNAAGNVLVDSPRFDRKLVSRIKAMGGIKYMFLTHKDDVADHALWAEEFGAQRIIHQSEANAQQGTDKCEIMLEGEGPWEVPGHTDLQIIHTPGHTYGHCVMYHEPSKALFTGDHVSFSRVQHGQLRFSKDYNWYSVPEQLKSIKKMLDYDFLHVLPGHGRPGHLRDAAHRLQLVESLLREEGAL